MRSRLYEIEHMLPELLQEEDAWQDVFVNYHEPFVERLWRPYGEERIYLHCIQPCPLEKTLFHPHPWPSAMRLHGTYEMTFGYGSGDVPPPVGCTLTMTAGTVYEMIDPNGWHAVRALDRPAMSLMVTGKPWGRLSPKSDTPLPSLPQEERQKILSFFRLAYPR